jgi:glutamate synthase domain-containing protein 3
VQKHADETGSPLAGGLLASWEIALQDFVQVTPHDVRRLRQEAEETAPVGEARA